MIYESADEQPPQAPMPRTLDAWSWVARARAAAARSVEPQPPEPSAQPTEAGELDSPAG